MNRTKKFFAILSAAILGKKKTKGSAIPKEPSGVKCETCGGSTDQINDSKVKCRYCGNIQTSLSKVVNVPLSEVKGKQEDTKEEPKRKSIKNSEPLFDNWKDPFDLSALPKFAESTPRFDDPFILPDSQTKKRKKKKVRLE